MTAASPPISTELSGWGNLPVEVCRLARPTELDEVCRITTGRNEASWIPRGLGRAYGDSALNGAGGVVGMTRLDRFLSFDESIGILECEAGVSLAEIIRHLLPRGWFPPVTPGTKFITLGGAVAADIHGKNHHVDGSFGNFVDSFTLLTAAGDVVECSRTKNVDLFEATLGGMGLTGCILTVRFRMKRTPSCYAAVEFYRTHDLDETLERFARSDDGFCYSVAWIDALARGKSLGRSVVMLANDAVTDELPFARRASPWTLPERRRKSVPFMLPGWTLNPLSVKLFNAVYYGANRSGRRVVDYDRFFYPLDGVHAWNRIYGRRGFVQFQALFPTTTSRAGLVAMLTEIAESRRASFLAVLKAAGPRGCGMLSYLYPGHTLALDFPNTGADLSPFLRKLEEILLRYGGRLYLAKDATMQPETFRAGYPRLDEFLAVKRRVDPENRFSSSQSKRLGLS